MTRETILLTATKLPDDGSGHHEDRDLFGSACRGPDVNMGHLFVPAIAAQAVVGGAIARVPSERLVFVPVHETYAHLLGFLFRTALVGDRLAITAMLDCGIGSLAARNHLSSVHVTTSEELPLDESLAMSKIASLDALDARLREIASRISDADPFVSRPQDFCERITCASGLDYARLRTMIETLLDEHAKPGERGYALMETASARKDPFLFNLRGVDHTARARIVRLIEHHRPTGTRLSPRADHRVGLRRRLFTRSEIEIVLEGRHDTSALERAAILSDVALIDAPSARGVQDAASRNA